ncbi:MAG TPA: uroporphyrinogen-III C-methyltransferase [Candidatus Desulfofervidus auxilii]|uniref:uroporphyrinogen-III C-methyltransferase n=1 Tax=Desulfofervidus auxilii TaxID=1621989 RepID=A0A7V0NEH4_DESA2|nr:uroporphyrinogen-III C-methyltransferase [Candidatus Desulfofervidus auxilii]
MEKQGKVYLVGAGPGDSGLITLKAKEILEKADVVIYDYLAPAEILEYAKNAEMLYVGKTAGKHTLSQDKINQLLIEKAKTGKIVVRLKGGDPFIFGRGGEEAEELVKANIPFEVVPGVTSAIAVPAYAGIPLTHRAYASSVAFITGHEDPQKPNSSICWEKLTQGVDTLVFLMGVGHLSAIVEKLIHYGRPQNTPVAIIRWGTLPDQETLISTLGNVVKDAKKRNLKPPAIIVIGEVVKLREKLNWWEKKPLFGKKILVTRTQEQASEIVKLLQSLGAKCYSVPTISIIPPSNLELLDKAIAQLKTYDWCLFTSVNGVKYFFERLEYFNKDVRAFGNVKIGVIGAKTAQALRQKGIKPDIMPNEFRAEALADALLKLGIKDKKILLARAEKARDVLPETLKAAGANIDIVPVYQTIIPKDKKVILKKLFDEGIDIIVFTSSSTVKHLAILMQPQSLSQVLKGIIIACIGPVTAQTLSEFGLSADIIPTTFTIESLVEKMIAYFT